MYHVSAQGVDERMINVHYYYCYLLLYFPQAVHSSARGRLELQYERMIHDVTHILNTHKRTALRHLDALHASRLAACNTHAAVVASQSQQLQNLVQRCKDLLQEDRRRHVLQCSGEAPPVGVQVQELETQWVCSGLVQTGDSLGQCWVRLFKVKFRMWWLFDSWL